jgi:hypothetical protein
MPRRVTLRWKLAGLLVFIAVLLVALTMVSLASLAKVSDGGRRNFTHVTQPLAALGSARALVNENAGLADRHILEGTWRPSARSSSASWPTTGGSSARSRPPLRPSPPAQERKSARFLRHNLADLPQRHDRAVRRLAREHGPRWPTSGPRSASTPPPTRSAPTSRTSTTSRSPRAKRGSRRRPTPSTRPPARARSCSR